MTGTASKTVNYAHRQQWLQSDEYREQLGYWQQQLANVAPLLELPTDRPRSSGQTYKRDSLYLELTQDLTQALRAIARQEGVTLHTTLLAAFKTLLYRYTEQSDIVVASPHIEEGGIANTLVLRTEITDELNFRQLLNRVSRVTLAATANAKLPLKDLVARLQLETDPSYNPLFQVMFALHENSNLKASSDYNCSTLDLTFDLRETAAGIRGYIEYNSNLFDPTTIARMADHWQTLLAGIIADIETDIIYLPLLTASEKQILTEPNQPEADYWQKQGIQELFEAQVAKTPNAVAVVFQDRQLTYQQLNCQANQLAHYLQSLGVKGESLVGICIERSLEMIVGLLGILKAGGAYVPLDPAYPQERLAYMVKDANVSVLLSQTKWQTSLPQNTAQVVNLDTDWSQIITHSTINPSVSAVDKNLAYVIYTSGSTGNPKGVMITHQGLSSFTQTAIQEYKITSSDRILQFASINFDAAVEEIFPCLCTGATLVLRTDEMLGLPTFFKTCAELKLTVLDLPTAYWHQLVAELKHKDVSLPESLRLVIIGGEAVLPEPVKSWQDYVNRSGKGDCLELINTYGPTEATVVATLYRISNRVSLQGEVPIGRPLAHLQTYILDQHQQLLPIGIPGELHIGGDGLARGYLNRPDITNDKFIVDPFNPQAGGRLYKTGDLAKYLPNGEIEYLGRIDNQVKIRGFRIELGEIESALTQHSAIDEAAVIVREDGEKTLIAYMVNSSATLKTQEVRSFLQDRLPNYMMPNAFVFLETMPLTPNGKLDRRALPAPDTSRQSDAIVRPTNDVEAKLVQIWSEVLKINPLGIEDNFFELGGHSLLAVKLIGEIERQFNRQLPLTVLVESPTIQQLAITLKASPSDRIFSPIIKLKTGNSQTPLFLVHDADGETILYQNLASYLKPEQTVYGIRPPIQSGSGAPMLPTRISEMAEYYVKEIRKVQPKGAYLIGGLCAGGVLAFEIACQLQAEGEEVPLVAIIDAVSPQGIGDRYISVSQDRKKSFLQAFDLEKGKNIKSLANLVKTAFTKVSNLVRYEVSIKTKKLTNNLRIKLLRYCCDRNLAIPKLCQNIPLRSIYIYAEDEYAQEKPSVYQGQLTLWRAK